MFSWRVLIVQRIERAVQRRTHDVRGLCADPAAHRCAGPPQECVARADEIRIRQDNQALLFLHVRIGEGRLEGRLLFRGDLRRRVLAFAIRPMFPLLLKPVHRGDVVLAEQLDVQGY